MGAREGIFMLIELEGQQAAGCEGAARENRKPGLETIDLGVLSYV